jgi:hypothetical protein
VRKSRVATAALVIAAVTTLSLAAVKAQGPGQGGQPPAPSPASPAAKPEAAAPSQSEGTKPETGEPAKPAEPAPSTGAGTPTATSAGETPSDTLAALLKEGFEVRATAFVPADAVTRQSGKTSSDAILVTLQKAAVSAVCFYTLKAYVSKKLGTIPACTVHR